MDTLIKDLESYSLWRISKSGLRNFAEFVSHANYNIHQNMMAPEEEISDVLLHEEELFPYSLFYAIKTKNGKYIGAIRVTQWDKKFPLPMSREFGIDINKMLLERNLYPTEIWHIARLAVNNVDDCGIHFSLKQRSELLRILLAQAFTPICTDENNVLLAECDDRFLRMTPHLNLLHTELIGEPIIYLASPTIPIVNTAKNLKPFLEENKQYCYV